MFGKILKWAGIALLSLVILLAAGFGFISYKVGKRVNRTYSFSKRSIAISTDSATVARGKHLVMIKGCNDCHGDNLGGKIMINDFPMGKLSAANLTSGKGGLGPDYTVEDWITALKHGIGTNGKPLLLMPSHESTQLTDQDIAAIIAYCRSVAPADNKLPPNHLGPLGKILTNFNKIPLLSVEMIDHQKAAKVSNEMPQTLVETGMYLAVSCSGCHRSDFKGGPAFIPGGPPVPNITASGNPGKWTEDQFRMVLRTGKTPSGKQLKNEDMPWKMTAHYTDEEINALYQFLRSDL
ncbi:c-type cytochrome [Pedobacter sp. JY14-1]|uniref:c-type cytochrome n=1 Tax=Pedobacter sp. JY14-1 TaxID=3034151 RepID=UPI0023E119E4|nr:c-type cytochrome [Pedobacter sp. JY14-1]